MRDRDDGTPFFLELHHKNLIEPAPMFLFLISRPFVKQVDVSIFQQCNNYREPLALASGEVRGAETVVAIVDLPVQLHVFQQIIEFLLIRLINAVETIKQVKIGKDDRKKTAVLIECFRFHDLAVSIHVSAIRFIQASQDLGER